MHFKRAISQRLLAVDRFGDLRKHFQPALNDPQLSPNNNRPCISQSPETQGLPGKVRFSVFAAHKTTDGPVFVEEAIDLIRPSLGII